jgi:hypothetical protein
MNGQPNPTTETTDATTALVTRNLLIGGMPGSGKSVALNLLTAYAALSTDSPFPVGTNRKEGGRRDADSGR